jgi:hypothetical protein
MNFLNKWRRYIMGRMTKGANMLIGFLRAVVTAFFATIFIIVLFPTISALSAVLKYGIWMFLNGDFYLLLLMLMAIIGVAGIVAKVLVPDIKSAE